MRGYRQARGATHGRPMATHGATPLREQCEVPVGAKHVCLWSLVCVVALLRLFVFSALFGCFCSGFLSVFFC